MAAKIKKRDLAGGAVEVTISGLTNALDQEVGPQTFVGPDEATANKALGEWCGTFITDQAILGAARLRPSIEKIREIAAETNSYEEFTDRLSSEAMGSALVCLKQALEAYDAESEI